MSFRSKVKRRLSYNYWARKRWAHRANLRFEEQSLQAIPTQLAICMTDACNILCKYCMRQEFKPPKGAFTLNKLKSLLRHMPYINGVCIMGLCEPFLNAETSDIVRWLKDKGNYSISLTTNGMVNLDSDKLDALLRCDDMVFSIDTADPETFRLLRGGGDLDRVMRNLVRVIQYKQERGLGASDKPPIHINAVITSLNFHQIPNLIKMLEPYAADLTYLMIDPVSRPDYSHFEGPFVLRRNEFERFVPEYRRLAAQSPLKVLGFDWLFKESFGWSRCCLAWQSMFIQPNGDVYFCYDYRYVLGNVFGEDPLNIWNNSRAQEFRRQLLSTNPPLGQCHFCNFARSGWQIGGVYYRQKEDVEPIEG